MRRWVIRSQWCHKSPACVMERKCSMCRTVGAGQVGWKRSRPAPPPLPPDPEIDTRASQPLRGKEKTHTSEHSLTLGALCTARDRTRGWWVGGWPKVCVTRCSPNASLRHVPACFPASGVCVCFFVCSSWCDGWAVFGESTPITHLLTGL